MALLGLVLTGRDNIPCMYVSPHSSVGRSTRQLQAELCLSFASANLATYTACRRYLRVGLSFSLWRQKKHFLNACARPPSLGFPHLYRAWFHGEFFFVSNPARKAGVSMGTLPVEAIHIKQSASMVAFIVKDSIIQGGRGRAQFYGLFPHLPSSIVCSRTSVIA